MSQDRTPDWIRAARDRHPIVDVLERLGVQPPARWNGSSDFMIRCPLPTHDDSTPSCVIHSVTNRFYCFGCGAHGDVLQLVQDVVGVRSVGDAINWLGGVNELHPNGSGAISHQAEGGREPRTSRERVLEINEAAWSELTAAPAAQVARGYLKRRGIDVTALERNSSQALAGYTPASRDGLVRSLRVFGFRDDELVDAGWAVYRADELVDRFHRRVLMPFVDDTERVLGVVGRDVTGSARAKYLNSPRTAAFQKGELLYAPNPIVCPVATLVVCEGPLDALAVEAWAAECSAESLRAVAPSGTSLTDGHATAVAGMSIGRVVLLPDGDVAGQTAGAAWRAQLADAGVESELLRLPVDHDPLSWFATGHSLDFDKKSRHQEFCARYPTAPIGPDV